MLFRFTRLWIALGLLVGIWALSAARQADPRAWVRPADAPRGPVKILQFYASVGMLKVGDKALLCYGVENARSVKISPALDNVYPSTNHCLQVGPDHTTHYTILAEGYDGRVATESLTLPVADVPRPPQRPARYAGVE
jgi:hypothetical protein